MHSSQLLRHLALTAVGVLVFCQVGCRSQQSGHVLSQDSPDTVGSHAAGSEVYKPLIDGAVTKLLGPHIQPIQPVGFDDSQQRPLRVCFIGVENKSAEELGDFKDQIYELIDSKISSMRTFQSISRRYVEAGLRDTRLRPDELFKPSNQRLFAAALEQEGQPFDYLLFAKLTSGTTQDNSRFQRDYLLTLELVNIKTGAYDKQSETLRKGYKRSRFGRPRSY